MQFIDLNMVLLNLKLNNKVKGFLIVINEFTIDFSLDLGPIFCFIAPYRAP